MYNLPAFFFLFKLSLFCFTFSLIELFNLGKLKSPEDHIQEVKNAWRKVEEEDQVMNDCYSIATTELMLLHRFQSSAASTHLQVPHVSALSSSFPFIRFPSLEVLCFINWHVRMSQTVFTCRESRSSLLHVRVIIVVKMFGIHSKGT